MSLYCSLRFQLCGPCNISWSLLCIETISVLIAQLPVLSVSAILSLVSWYLKSQFVVQIQTVQSQFLFLFLLSVCCWGRWTFKWEEMDFKFVKEALETLDSINQKRLESQREYKVDVLVHVFLNLEVLTSVS